MREWGKVRLLDTDLVFPGKNPKNPVLFEKSWRTALKSAGIEDFRFHDLRHSSASYLAMNNVSVRTIAEILGHKTLSMVQRYSHLSSEHLRSEIARTRSEEHTSELQSQAYLVCRLLLEKKKKKH